MKRNLPLILITIFLTIMAYVTLLSTFNKLAFVLLTADLLSIVHVYTVKGAIHLTLGTTKKAIQKEEACTIKLTVTNNSFLPTPYVYIRLKEGHRVTLLGPNRICVTLGCGQTKEIPITYKGELSGREIIGIKEVVVMDYFHIIKKKLKFKEEKEISVLPQIVDLKESQEIRNQLVLVKTEIQSTTSIGKQSLLGEEIGYELAPYKEGDSKKLIHWKLFAQKGSYLVRQREENEHIKTKVVIVLDSISKEKDIEEKEHIILQDKMISACVSFIHVLIEEGQEVYFLSHEKGQWEKKYIQSSNQLKQLAYELTSYSTIKEVEGAGETRLPLKILEEISREIGYLKLLITSSLDPELMNEMVSYGKDASSIQIVTTVAQKEEVFIQSRDQMATGLMIDSGQIDNVVWELNDNYEMIKRN